jgi:glutamine synthetase
MNNFSVAEVIKFVRDNDVKFIRLAFCDIFGEMKNISIMPSELPKAFDTGIPFDASAIKGFMNVEESDLFLVPDASTMAILPWRPSQGGVIRFFCNIRMPDGRPFEGDGRNLLKQAVSYAASKDYTIKVGTECEFYLFELDEHGRPTRKPHDDCGYCDIAPLDKGENVRREICLTLEEMGIYPEMSHHEQGRGQHEIVFKYSEALKAVDNLVTFKSVVKVIAARHGLHASFMPKPLIGSSGSGLHINLSLFREHKNVFDMKGSTKGISESFVAGIMDCIEEISVFTNPIKNSYARLGEYEAPRYVSWSCGNRSQLVRIPAAEGDLRRMELRSPDPACSSYIALALLIYAGIEGIDRKAELDPPMNINLFEGGKETKSLRKLPKTLDEAIKKAASSQFVKAYLPASMLSKYLKYKKEESQKFTESIDAQGAEMDYYFNRL